MDVRGKKRIDGSALHGIPIEKGSILLLYTGIKDQYSSDSYFSDSAPLTEDFAKRIIELGVIMVGMDMFGLEDDVPW